MLKGDYTVEKYSIILPYKDLGVGANEARALRARSHMALVSQNWAKGRSGTKRPPSISECT